jgi:hypothetical protein
MSDAKKDDHGGGHEKPKSSLGAKLVGVGIAILMLLLFVYYLGATVPEVIRGGATLVGDSGNATTLLGRGFGSMASGIRNLNIGFNAMLIEILVMLVKAVLIGWLIFLLFNIIRPKKGGDDHHPPAGGGH